MNSHLYLLPGISKLINSQMMPGLVLVSSNQKALKPLIITLKMQLVVTIMLWESTQMGMNSIILGNLSPKEPRKLIKKTDKFGTDSILMQKPIQ